jgi:hypothetical protein
MKSGWGGKKTGLTWGDKPESGLTRQTLPQERITSATNNTSSTKSNGETIMQLTDIIGERVITVEAKVSISGKDYTARQDVRFGNGPLSEFRSAPKDVKVNWLEAYEECNGVAPSGKDDPSNWTITDNGVYHGGGKMPSVEELQRVSPTDTSSGYSNPRNGQGAAWAAGWGDVSWSVVWAGEAYGDEFYGTDNARNVDLEDGEGRYYNNAIEVENHAACRR